MPKARSPFQKVIALLQAGYGRPQPPTITDPLEMILFENVAYLVSDEQRQAAFAALRDRVGTRPAPILAAPRAALLEVAKLGGMHPDRRVDRLRLVAQIARVEFQCDVRRVLKQPLAQARRALKMFPGIGALGAEKILLFSKTHPILALESNGLRALVRLGFGQESRSYAATYRSVQQALQDQIKLDCAWLIRAHQLLRRHGQELCRRTEPLCSYCPLTRLCRYYRNPSGNPLAVARVL
jgi:endonuclease-3